MFDTLSLICYFQELYRYLIDDFAIQYCQKLAERDLAVKAENLSTKKKAKREYLNESETIELTNKLNKYFEENVEISRIRVGKRQNVETLINEEEYSFAKFLRGEQKTETDQSFKFEMYSIILFTFHRIFLASP